MASQFVNFALPEFCFLDGMSHLGDLLEHRTVIQHIRSYTIIEAISLDDVSMSEFKTHTYQFTYINSEGGKEKHLFALHFSLAIEDNMPMNDTLQDIFDKAEKWYKDYLDWEDQNILEDEF